MKYDSEYERRFHTAFPKLEREPHELPYVIEHTYTPDFYDRVAEVYYETKGYWDAADRRKLLAVVRQNPDIKLVMVFQNPHLRINKRSKTTYAQWCTRHGISWRKF
jgi:hypothetical protein